MYRLHTTHTPPEHRRPRPMETVLGEGGGGHGVDIEQDGAGVDYNYDTAVSAKS